MIPLGQRERQSVFLSEAGIIPIDLGSIVCDYDRVFEIVERKKSLFWAMDDHSNPLADLSLRIQKEVLAVRLSYATKLMRLGPPVWLTTQEKGKKKRQENTVVPSVILRSSHSML